jgi:hypothetical protein
MAKKGDFSSVGVILALTGVSTEGSLRNALKFTKQVTL